MQIGVGIFKKWAFEYRGLADLASETRGSAMAEGPRDAIVSRNSATTKNPI